MTRKNLLLLFILFCFISRSNAQVSIGTLEDPDASAIVDIVSTEKGVLFPRMTTEQRISIANPANGLCVYDTEENRLFTYSRKDNGWNAVGLQTDEDNNGPQKKIKNVILFIASGMGPVQLQAGFIKNNNYLEMTTFPYTAFLTTYSAESKTTDSAAAATALSTGVKTRNGYIGTDISGGSLPNIMETVKKKGLATGIVVTSSVTHPTPAAFYSHQTDTSLHKMIARDFIYSDMDICIGGGRNYFDTDVLNTLTANGYQLHYSLDYLTPQADKAIVLAAPVHLPKIAEGRGSFLSNATLKALDILKKNEQGFFLLIEGSHMDMAGSVKDYNTMLQELTDFDSVVGLAKKFAAEDGNTLVVVCGDHETGGLIIYGSSSMELYYNTSQINGKETCDPVPVFAFGPGAEEFTGFFDNTDMKTKIEKLLGFN